MSASSCHWSLGEGVPSQLEGTIDVAPPVEDPPLEAGEAIGEGYRVVAVLGRGASGVVYRVAQEGADREVALKLLASGCEPALRERLLREGQVMAALDHPGVGRVFSAGEHAGRPFLVFELLEGCRTLEAAWGELDRDALLEVIQQVAEALGHAHAHGVVHRDVKPENVLLDADGQPRVIDFGLARTAQAAERLTQTGALLGTPLYMAPECFRAASGVGPHSDVWALGVMLHRALSGELPFQATQLHELALQVEAHDPPSLLGRGVSPELEAVWRQALQRQPRHRYRDAAALADDLARARRGEAVLARAVSAGRSRRWLLPLASALALAAVGVGVWRWRPPSPSPVISRTPAATPERPAPDPVEQALAAKDFPAAERLARQLLEPQRSILLARIAEARGEDPVAVLERARAAWPEKVGLLLELIDRRVAGGRFREALAAARAGRKRTPDEQGLTRRWRILTELFKPAPSLTVLQTMPATWRRAVIDRLRHRGRRDAEFLRAFVSTPPLWIRTRSAGRVAEYWILQLRLSPAQRAARAQAWLTAARELASADSAAHREAVHGLRLLTIVGTVRDLPVDEAREKASAVLAQASGRSGARQPTPLGRDLTEYLDLALALDPQNQVARYFKARERFQKGTHTALRKMVVAVNRCPFLYRFLYQDLKLWAASRALRGEPGLWALRRQFPQEAHDRLVRTLIATAATETDGATPEQIAGCYADSHRSLQEYRTDLGGLTAHALLSLRHGRPHEARAMLGWAREAYTSTPVAEFYLALVQMAEGAESAVVIRQLQRAKAEGFPGFDGDTRGLDPRPYPEAAPYLRLEAFRGYFRAR